MDNSSTIQTIALYVAVVVPLTVAISNIARILLQWLDQKHQIGTARIEQEHRITANYLDRALDPIVPLAIRHQLLRFLATPETSASRLQAWAASELERVGGIVEETNRAVVDAEKELQVAATTDAVAAAERKLAEAVQKQRSLLEPPVVPPVSAASLRAGLIDEKDLNGLSLRESNLTDAKLSYRNMRGSDLTKADLTKVSLQGTDLRASSFRGAKLERTVFHAADLRGTDFTGAVIEEYADFSQARLEGAIMLIEGLESADLRATYDSNTIWPDEFNPEAHGGVSVEASNE